MRLSGKQYLQTPEIQTKAGNYCANIAERIAHGFTVI